MSENEKINLTISFEPYEELVVLQKTFFQSPDDLARFSSLLMGGKPSFLYWVKNIVFIYFPVPASTATIAKLLVEKKRCYWSFLAYSFMENYSSRIETKERLIVPIIDVSHNPFLVKVGQWLQTQQ